MRLWILAAAAQAVALAVLAHRFFQQANVSALTLWTRRGACGLQARSEYVIASRNVVLPEGIMPAAGKYLQQALW